jgi:PAS domain S-box-containing protein
MVDLISQIANNDNIPLFNIISENSSDLIAILNDEFKFEYVNSKAHQNLTGYTKQDLVGKKANKLIHPKDYKKSIKNLKNVVKSGVEQGELRIKCKDENYKWVHMKAIRIRGDQEQQKILLIAKEIMKPKLITSKNEDRFKEMLDNLTEIRFWKFLQPKQAIAAYQESQEMLRLIMDSIPQFIAWKDKNLVYVGCNTNFIEFMGFNDEREIIGKTDFDLKWTEEQAVSLRVKDMRVLESSYAEYHIIEFWKLNNREIWLDINIIPLHDLNGNVVGILETFDDITDRKKIEEALRDTISQLKNTNRKLKESEERYRDLTEFLPEAIYEADLDFNVKYVNPSGLEKFGFTQNDIQSGLKIFDGFDPNEFQKVRKNMENLFNDSNPESHEYLMKKKDGTTFNGEILSTPLYRNEKPVGLIGVIHDITERKNAEQKLKASEKKYRHLFNSSPYAIWLLDLKGYVKDCNVMTDKLLSVTSREDIIGKHFIEVLKLFQTRGDPRFRDLQEILPRRFKKLLKDEPLIPLEFEIARGDGKEFWITLDASLVNVGDETLVQVFIRDISDRKKAEMKIKESEEKYRLISEHVNDLILILDADGKFVFCNETFKKILGYHPNELIGKTPLSLVHPDDKKGVISDFYKGLAGDKTTSVARFKRKDSEYVWIESIGNVSYDEKGNPIKLFAVSRDITERKMMEKKLRKSEEELKILNKQLEQKVRERTKELLDSQEKLKKQNIELKKLDHLKDEFITAAAHELKTPLISIAGYTDYILMKYQDLLNHEIKEDLLIVQRNIKRLQNLMNQLLDVLKIDSQKMVLNVESTKIKELIKNCVEELSYLIKEKHHDISINIDDCLEVKLDEERIFQVISNLLSNAIKFTPEGGKIEMAADLDDKGKKLIFKIKDSGIGLTADEIQRMFKKFEMIEREEGKFYQKGTGLGLYISKGFIQAHGGEIWATSEGKNKGTTIQFTLPI